MSHSAGAITWEPDGHQLSMLADPDCRTVTCAAMAQGPFDNVAAQGAFDRLLARHSMLRSHYSREPDGRVFVITPSQVSVGISVTDLRGLPPPECREAVLRMADSFAWSGPDHQRGPLVSCTVARLTDVVTLFLVGMHHSLADAASLNIIRRDLLVLYRSALLDVPPPLESIATEYRDFVRERAQWLQSDHATPHIEYWRRVLSGSSALFRLPYDRIEPPDASALRPDIAGAISKDALERLRRIAASQRTTLSALFAAIVAIVLASWSGRSDVATWICHLGRPRKELFRVVGCFIDHWLLRVDISPAMPFAQVLQRIHQLTVDATPHLRVTVHRLIPELQRIPAGEVHPAIVLNFMPYARASGVAAAPASPTPHRPNCGLSKNSALALIIDCYEFADRLSWSLTHSSHLFEEITICRFSTALATVAERVALDPALKVRDLSRGALQIPRPSRAAQSAGHLAESG